MRLDQPITLNTVTEVSQPDGSLILTRTGRRVFAQVRPMSGRERYSAGQVTAPAMYRFTIRNTLVNDTDVIEWRGSDYNVRFVGTAGERDLYIHVEAEKDVAV